MQDFVHQQYHILKPDAFSPATPKAETQPPKAGWKLRFGLRGLQVQGPRA